MVHAIDEMAGGWEWRSVEWRCRFDGLIDGSLPATSIMFSKINYSRA